MDFTSTDLFLVTGASSGIGRSVAELLVDEGARVVAVARSADKLEAVRTGCRDPMAFLPEPRDLGSDIDEIPAWVRAVSTRHGKLRGMVLAAGARLTIPLKAVTRAGSLELFNLNYFSTVQLCRAFSDSRVFDPRSPSITVISSVAARRPEKGLITYASTKAALDISVQCMALELSEKRIRVNSILPSVVDTEMVRAWQGAKYEAFVREIESVYPLGIGHASDVAGLCLYLASERARWVTGQNWVIDGGASLA